MKKNQLRLNETLRALVDEYIWSNVPVSSLTLNDKHLTKVSSATLRLDLYKLEQMNLIQQPHTSSGRVPTIQGYRRYLELIAGDHDRVRNDRMEILRDLLIHYYKDTPQALHYIMQMLAQMTDQLSFVAEPEVSSGYLAKLEVFRIGPNKYIFVMSLDSGLDKTVIMKCENDLGDEQLKRLVRYLNDELAGLRIYDIANKYLVEMRENLEYDTTLISGFLRELHRAFIEISDFFIHYDGSIKFLEQPEFDSKVNILNFMNMIQRQDVLLKLMQGADLKKNDRMSRTVSDSDPAPFEYDRSSGVKVLLGEELSDPLWTHFAVIFARYEIYEIPGYLGVIAPMRTDYRKLIPLVRDIAATITQTTRKGMMVPNK